MAASYLFGGEIKPEGLCPCFFLYGEETYLAEEFVQQLKETVLRAEGEDFHINIERFSLGETRWADVIDVARTVPFFFTPRRLLVIEGQADEIRELSPVEESILKDYFRSPSLRTVLVIIFAGRAKKGHPVVNFFLKKLPASSVLSKELKPLKEEGLKGWIDKKLEERGKGATSEAKTRLIDAVGSDLRRIANELEKIANFAADKRLIDIDDINQVCGWVKPAVSWELTDGLERRDTKQCLVVLNQLFREGVEEEYIVAIIANFFRDILAAKVWLQENRDKKEIFAKLRPFLQPKFSIYPIKFKEFFARIEDFSMEELTEIIAELELIDTLVKTADFSAQPRLEAFIFNYCKRRGQKKIG